MIVRAGIILFVVATKSGVAQPLLNGALGDIDLDPASSEVAQGTVKARHYFTKSDDALHRQWHGRVFINPPYSRDGMPRFIEKLITEFQADRVSEAIALVHSYTDPCWFHDLARFAAAICFTRGRIHFVSPYGDAAAPVHGSAFFYLGSNPEKFIGEFEPLGLVVLPVHNSHAHVHVRPWFQPERVEANT